MTQVNEIPEISLETETPPSGPLEHLASYAMHVAAILLQVAAVALVVNALYRYTIGGGFGLISEGTRFSLLFVVFLGLAGTHLAGGHVRVEILLSSLPQPLRNLIENYIVPIASVFFLSLIAWSGWVATLQMFHQGTTTPSRPSILMWPIAAIIPIGSGLLILILIKQFVRRLVRVRT